LFFEGAFDDGDVGGAIDALGFVFGDEDADTSPVFEGAELLQLFDLFEASEGPADELEEKIALVAVNAVVPENGNVFETAREGNAGAGKIEGVAPIIEDDFDDVGVVAGFVEDGGGGDHFGGIVFDEDVGEAVDEVRVDERFVALDVEDGGGFGIFFDDFDETVGARRMIGASDDDLSSEGAGDGSDAFVVGGDIEGVEAGGFLGLFPDVLDEGFASDEGERFAGKARGGPTGGNDADDVHNFLILWQ